MGVGLDQHFSNILEALPACVPEPVQRIHMGEVHQQAGYVIGDIRFADIGRSDQMLADKFGEKTS